MTESNSTQQGKGSPRVNRTTRETRAKVQQTHKEIKNSQKFTSEHAQVKQKSGNKRNNISKNYIKPKQIEVQQAAKQIEIKETTKSFNNRQLLKPDTKQNMDNISRAEKDSLVDEITSLREQYKNKHGESVFNRPMPDILIIKLSYIQLRDILKNIVITGENIYEGYYKYILKTKPTLDLY